jgi:hypothetical protein
VVTAEGLEKLEAADKSGLMAWLRSGATISKPVVRTFEREKLQAKLKVDTYEGRIAATALTEAERQIDVLNRQIAILEERRPHFVKLAMIERATSDGEAYMLAIRALEDRLAVLLGLGSVAGAVGENWETEQAGEQKFFRSYGSDASFQTNLPYFGLSTVAGSFGATDAKWGGNGRPQVNVDRDRVEAGAKPWKDLLALWSMDPRAEPPTDKGTR